MRAIDYLKTVSINLDKNNKDLNINEYISVHINLFSLIDLMEDYALKAFMAGEDNGRKRLSPKGELDERGSQNDFENWKAGLLEN